MSEFTEEQSRDAKPLAAVARRLKRQRRARGPLRLEGSQATQDEGCDTEQPANPQGPCG